MFRDDSGGVHCRHWRQWTIATRGVALVTRWSAARGFGVQIDPQRPDDSKDRVEARAAFAVLRQRTIVINREFQSGVHDFLLLEKCKKFFTLVLT